MSLADKALWVMERNSSRELTLGSIAAACEVSRSHLANAFGTASGWPVMAYLRARRLSEAAKRLAAGAPDILSVALEFGYGSHEAFTRAFREQFGATPEEVRNSRSTERIDLVAPLRLTNGRARTPVPTVRELRRLRLVGLSAPCSYESAIGIPAQWQAFMCDHYAEIADKAPGIPIGVCRAPFQFACWTPHHPRHAAIREAREDDAVLALCRRVAARAAAGALPDATGGATHYHDAARLPRWAIGEVPVAEIGGLVFYRLAPN